MIRALILAASLLGQAEPPTFAVVPTQPYSTEVLWRIRPADGKLEPVAVRITTAKGDFFYTLTYYVPSPTPPPPTPGPTPTPDPPAPTPSVYTGPLVLTLILPNDPTIEQAAVTTDPALRQALAASNAVLAVYRANEAELGAPGWQQLISKYPPPVAAWQKPDGNLVTTPATNPTAAGLVTQLNKIRGK